MERADFVQERFRSTEEYSAVTGVADALSTHLGDSDIGAMILSANQPGRSSAHVQAVLLEHPRQLGFRDESKGLFSEHVSALRPDYFMPIGDTGIILEVERGKTTINNMDLLDFWKCHICAHADYLFLLVPEQLRQNPTMTARREFVTVQRRLATILRAAQLHERSWTVPVWLLTDEQHRRSRPGAPHRSGDLAHACRSGRAGRGSLVVGRGRRDHALGPGVGRRLGARRGALLPRRAANNGRESPAVLGTTSIG